MQFKISRWLSGKQQTSSADPAIGDYAAIGNCKTLALVSLHGSIDWFCLPDFSGASVFAALLDQERGGRFAITPRDILRIERAYLDGSNVLCTTFHCKRGVLELTDCMAVDGGDVRDQHDMAPEHEVIRIARCTAGEVELHAVYRPRPGYAKKLPRLVSRGRLGWQCTLGSANIHLLSNLSFASTGAATLEAVEQLRSGEQREASLSASEHEIGVIAPLGASIEQRLAATLDWWRAWVAGCSYRGPWRDAIVRSCLALKLLTYSLSGAVVAAGTTSLPESLQSRRNWDYRYCWLRDSSLTLSAFMDLGLESEGAAFLAWLLHATRLTQPRLEPLYDVYGRASQRQRELPQLRGWRGVGPVRIGNGAASQLQLDVYGEVLLAAHDFVQHGGRLDAYEKCVVAGFARSAAKYWREADSGLWEVQSGPRHNTYSKLMCWTALDRALRLHEQIGLPIDTAHLHRERDALRSDIERHGFDAELGSYIGYYGSQDADASLLLIPRMEYLAVDDPKMRGTLAHIERQLGVEGGLLYRYPPGPGYDGVAGRENLFVICGFWRVQCLAQMGRTGEARALFERLLTLANPVGLYAEELDDESLALRGNFPQGFSHAGLIAAALALDRAEQSPTSP